MIQTNETKKTEWRNVMKADASTQIHCMVQMSINIQSYSVICILLYVYTRCVGIC